MSDCVLCNEPIGVDPSGWDGGHNAYPVAEGRCCQPCNRDMVVPERLLRAGYPLNQFVLTDLDEMSR